MVTERKSGLTAKWGKSWSDVKSLIEEFLNHKVTTMMEQRKFNDLLNLEFEEHQSPHVDAIPTSHDAFHPSREAH